jgi:hypothetical protein
MHLDSKLKEVVEALALRLGFGDSISPNISAITRQQRLGNPVAYITHIPCRRTKTA